MILDELAAHARERVRDAKQKVSQDEMKAMANALPVGEFLFEHALKNAGLSFICEVKKASPSKGVISLDFPYIEIAKDYEDAGACCISVLTEPKWFQGSDQIFKEIRKSVSLPMLRKDFLVDEYQLYESKVMGADAVLLICALLDTDTVKRYLRICDSLGLCALTEAHDDAEIRSAVSAGARVIGVNNRNLKNFSVDFENAKRLRSLVPEGVLFVAESGVKTAEDAALLSKIGADAVLIGETLMRAHDRKAMLREMTEAAG